MTDSRWARVQALFDEALAQPPDDRDRFLAARCEGDAPLLEEVSSLLAADAADASLLDQGPMAPPAAAYVPAADKDLAVGDVLDDYEIEAKLGEGSFGAVFKARHQVIRKVAALKVLHREHAASPEWTQRFLNEARSVNEIAHPNIIDIFGFSKTPDGRLYFVMEYLEAPSLAEVLTSSGRMPLDEALPIMRGLAAALDAAHARGVVHRDLKPANVIVQKNEAGTWEPKLLDFGIAKIVAPDSEGSSKTETGQALGTPAFMAPEQIRGEAVDGNADVYAFGVLCYRMLTGVLPFRAATAFDLMVAHTRAHPQSPSQRVAELGPDVDAAILSMLAKDPAQRPSNLEEVVAQLAQPDAAAVAPPTRRRAWIAGMVVAAAGVGGVTWALAGGRGPRPPTAGSSSEPVEAVAIGEQTSAPRSERPAEAVADLPPSDDSVSFVDVSIRGTPTGTEVSDDSGNLLGIAPGVIPLPSGDDAVVLWFRRAGYVGLKREVVPSEDRVLDVRLRSRKRKPPKPGLNPDLESPFSP